MNRRLFLGLASGLFLLGLALVAGLAGPALRSGPALPSTPTLTPPVMTGVPETPTPAPTPTPGPALRATLETAQVDSRASGVEIAISLTSDRAQTLTFDPQIDLSVTDNRGSRYSLVWADYRQTIALEPRRPTPLVRALFRGPITDPTTTDVRIALHLSEPVEPAQWTVPVQRPLSETAVAADQPVEGGGIRLTLGPVRRLPDESLEVQVTITNTGAQPLRFPFSPAHDLVLLDGGGQPQPLRWAEYAGVVELAPGQSRSLVRAAYILSRPAVTTYTLGVGNLPGVGRAAWRLTVEREPAGR